jgi:hypothetical protein
MRSEELAELVRGHADDGEDVPQGALGHVLARVDRDGNPAPIGVLHHVVAAIYPLNDETGTLKRFDYLRSCYGRNSTRHRAESYQNSGYVECHSQLAGWPDHIEQRLKRGAQVSDSLFLCRPVANRTNTWPDQGRSAPDAVFVLLDGVGHVNESCHESSIACNTRFLDNVEIGTSWDVLSYHRTTGRVAPGSRQGESR